MNYSGYSDKDIIECMDKTYKGFKWGKLYDTFYLTESEDSEYLKVESFKSLKDLKEYVDMIIV